MKFIKNLQKLSLNQKLIILWSIIAIIGIYFSVWRINIFRHKVENFTKDDLGIIPQEETVEEIRKGISEIKESTEVIKEGFDAIKNLTDEIRESEKIPDDYPNFLLEDNKNNNEN